MASDAVDAVKEKVANKYRVFQQDTDDRDHWHDLGVVEANGVESAKKQAVKEFGLTVDEQTQITLVAIADRFWRPTTAKVKTTSSVVFD